MVHREMCSHLMAARKLSRIHDCSTQPRGAKMNLLLSAEYWYKFIMNGRLWAAQNITECNTNTNDWRSVLRFYDNIQIARAVYCDGAQMCAVSDQMNRRVCVCARGSTSRSGNWSAAGSERGVMSPTPQRRSTAHLFLLIFAGNWQPSAAFCF
jgi:hypothetical protein